MYASRSILSQRGPQVVGAKAGLVQDRPEQARTDRLPSMERHGYPTPAIWMFELGVRSSLGYDHPAERGHRVAACARLPSMCARPFIRLAGQEACPNVRSDGWRLCRGTVAGDEIGGSAR